MNLFKHSIPVASLLAPFIINLCTQPSFAVDDECRNLNLTNDLSAGGADNEINGGRGCHKTPDAYVVEAFKLGLCPVGSNPLSSSGFDPSACSIIWQNPSGEEANLVASNGDAESFILDESNASKPPNGDYGFAFVVIGPTIKLRASVVVGSQTWLTSGDVLGVATNADINAQYSKGKLTGSAELVEIRTGYVEDRNGNEACYSDGLVVDGKTIHAAFLDSDEQSIVTLEAIQAVSITDGISTNRGHNLASCPASFIAGVQELSTPITITDSTETANISFLTTHNGVWLESINDNGTSKVYFDVGPFSLDMTVQ